MNFLSIVAAFASIIAAIFLFFTFMVALGAADAAKKTIDTMVRPRITCRFSWRRERSDRFPNDMELINSEGIRMENQGIGPAFDGIITVDGRMLMDRTEGERVTFHRLAVGIPNFYPSQTSRNLIDILQRFRENHNQTISIRITYTDVNDKQYTFREDLLAPYE